MNQVKYQNSGRRTGLKPLTIVNFLMDDVLTFYKKFHKLYF